MVDFALKSGRAAAERLMVDAARVYRLTGVEVVDPATHAVVAERALVYEGKCKVQTWEGYESTPKGGGHEFTIQRYQVHFPVGSFQPEVGMIVVITETTFDPLLLGREYYVKALLHKSAATAYRLGISEDTA